MRRYLIIWVAVLALTTACGSRQTTASDEDVTDDSIATADSMATDSLKVYGDGAMPKAADELFDDFVFNFTASKKLQLERVQFPLPMVNGDKKTLLSKNQWKTEQFFMRQGYYTLLFDNEKQQEIVKDTTVCHVVVEKIYFNTNSVIQYVFNRLHGLWKLTEIRTIPISASINASFLAFYHDFASDLSYQQQHLNETVQFVGPDPDDDFSQMEGIITPDTWEAFAPQLPQRMIYNIIYGQPRPEGNSKVFVLRGIANGMELEMTFRRKSGEWRLMKLTT